MAKIVKIESGHKPQSTYILLKTLVNRPRVRRTAMGCPNLPVLGQMGLMLLKLPLGPCLVVNAYPFNILIAFIIHLITRNLIIF